MRLDMFLKLSRIIPRRPLAKRMCDDNRIRLNDAPAKASQSVAPGDLITVELPGEIRHYRINGIPTGKNVSRDDARELVELIATRQKGLLE